MASKPLPTPEELRQLLTYEPNTGSLTWKRRTPSMFAPGNAGSHIISENWNKRYSGREAGSVNPIHGYRIIGLGRLVGAHRVAWAIHYGSWSDSHIDHINGDKTDNRIENLNAVSCSQNQMNAKRRIDNKSGTTGVYSRAAYSGGWVARITVRGQVISLGTFSTIEEATRAREDANRRYGFSERHGT